MQLLRGVHGVSPCEQVFGSGRRCRGSIAKHGLMSVVYPSSRDRQISNEQLLEGRCFVGSRGEPKEGVGFREFGVGESKSAEAFIEAGEGNGSIGNPKPRVAR